MEQYNAAIAVMHEFGEAIDRAAILSGEGTLYEMLRGAYGAQDDGSVLLQLPAVGAFLVRPDDALTLPPWMRPDAPSDDDEG